MEGFCPLASGSKGNCIYLGTKNTKLLIDLGINRTTLIDRLKEIHVSLEEINAILISHEHTDHIAGLKCITNTLPIPVLSNLETAKILTENLMLNINFKIFSKEDSFYFRDILITPFSVSHDAVDPMGFCLSFSNIKIGICTDLGFASPFIINHLSQCNYLYIEANHDPDLVLKSSRPPIYKDRVLSHLGHLSNQACANVIKSIYHPNLKQIYLAHLSEECNRPEIAKNAVLNSLEGNQDIPIIITKQNDISPPIIFSNKLVQTLV